MAKGTKPPVNAPSTKPGKPSGGGRGNNPPSTPPPSKPKGK